MGALLGGGGRNNACVSSAVSRASGCWLLPQSRRTLNGMLIHIRQRIPLRDLLRLLPDLLIRTRVSTDGRSRYQVGRGDSRSHIRMFARVRTYI